ncbi:MAG: cupin domain-containing protein [Chthoniobacterales bacterium]|jgi:mannose-6-phosphate isomerase-like protein (cupin superfamily)|nr:cupin domain-containing protein [Chthoniobacterales bacterium]
MPEFFIVLKGPARMALDGIPHALNSGDAITLSPGETDELSNPSGTPLTFLVAGWLA